MVEYVRATRAIRPGGVPRGPARGGAVNHHRRGAGEPLVLIHGIGSRWQIWSPVIDALAEHHDVIAADVAGLRALAGARPRASSRRCSPTRTPSSASSASSGCGGRTWRATRWAAASRSSWRGGASVALGHRDLARGLLDPTRAPLQPARRSGSSHDVPAPVRRTVAAADRRGRRPNAPHGTVSSPAPGASPPRTRAPRSRTSGRRRPSRRRWPPSSGYVFRAGHELRHVPVTVAWGSRDRLLLFGRQAPRARRALPDAHHVTLDGPRPHALLRRSRDGGRGDAAWHRGGRALRRARDVAWSCSPRCRPPRRRRPLRCPASAAARTSSSSYGSGVFGRWFVDASACRPTATGSTRRATRAPAGPSSRTWPTPPTPGRSSATTTWWPTPTTTATRSSGARTACTSGSTATRPPTASTPAASATCAPAAGRSARSTPTGRAARAPSACSAPGYSRRTLAAAGLAVDEHVYAPFGDDPVLLHDVTIRNRTAQGAVGELVRVLGREPVGARQGRARAASARRAGTRGAASCPSRQAAEGPDRRPLRIFAAALRGPVGGPRHRRHALLRRGRPGGSRGRGRGPAGRPAGGRRGPRPGGAHAVRAARAAAAGARRRGHASLRVRRRAAARDPERSSRAGARRDGRSRAASGAGPAGCRRRASAPGATGSRASSSGPRTRSARAPPTRSARAAT